MTDDMIIARALHVLALVHWIGGVSFVTLVILPLALGGSSPADGLGKKNQNIRGLWTQSNVVRLQFGALAGIE
jgi:uncharacterized membrane protein